MLFRLLRRSPPRSPFTSLPPFPHSSVSSSVPSSADNSPFHLSGTPCSVFYPPFTVTRHHKHSHLCARPLSGRSAPREQGAVAAPHLGSRQDGTQASCSLHPMSGKKAKASFSAGPLQPPRYALSSRGASGFPLTHHGQKRDTDNFANGSVDRIRA